MSLEKETFLENNLLLKLAAKSREEMKAQLQKAQDALNQGLKILPPRVQNLSTMAGTVGEILVESSQSMVQAAIRKVIREVLPQHEEARHPSAETRTETNQGKKIVVWLVHPTNYRQDGTPRKYKKQILPSNAIGQLWALMPQSVPDGQKNVPVERHFIEDTAQPFDIDAIVRSIQGDDVKGIVMLCGIQTNQWPRALDLALLCRQRDIPVVAGGYHVRADLPFTEKQAEDLGISLAIGEAESPVHDGRLFLEAILQDLWNDDLKPSYRQQENPNIESQKLSEVIPEYQNLMINPAMATMETSRGCPLPCSFCTIRTIGGTEVRARTPSQMKEWLHEVYEKQGIRSIFITDDNFARSDQRFEILKILAELREDGFPLNAMIQVDTKATSGRTGAQFVEACKKAGVHAVFLGIESVDPGVLKDMNKPQNHPERYKEMIHTWHGINVLTQCGFIIGNQKDTTGVGKRSAEALLDMGIDVAAAYVLTPLPGSVDYHRFHQQGFVHEKDFSLYDSHSAACIKFPGGLSPEEVKAEYDSFYQNFFAWKNFPRLADRLHDNTLRAATRQWIWYKYASSRGDNPMYSGMGNIPPDFVRGDFPDQSPPSVADLAPKPHGPGSPLREKKKLQII